MAILPQHIWTAGSRDLIILTWSKVGRSVPVPIVWSPPASRNRSLTAAMIGGYKTGFAELPEVELPFVRIPGGDAVAATRLFAQGEADFGGALARVILKPHASATPT
ncbi:MAG: hypothetical protein R2932_11065 [Caldilineaceae bacterium]